MQKWQPLTINDAKQLQKKASPLFVDVRTYNDYQAGHIPQALHLQQQNFSDFVATTDKKQTIIVYCYRGNSSKTIANLLCEQGFENIYSLEGGYNGWQEQSID